MLNSQIQKMNILEKYLPFYESVEKQINRSFEEIFENLSRLIQAQEFQPGFALWSSKLQQNISLHGYHFSKENHLKLIRLYLSILSVKSLNLSDGKICLDLLAQLTRFVNFPFRFG